MEIVCPMCNARYRISNQRVPRARAVARCKKCGGQISIEPAVAVQTGSIPVIEKSGESTRPPFPGTGDSARMAMLGNYPELRILNPEKFDFGEIFAPDKNGR